MKSKKIKLFASFCFLFIGLTVSTKKAESENIKFVHQAQKYSVKNEEDVLDYTTVLNSYYELAIGDAEKPTETFEQFYDSYYSESSVY